MRISQIWMQFRILHGALLASVAVYGVIVVVGTRGPASVATTPTTINPGLLLPLFGGLAAAVLLVLVPLLRGRLMPRREEFPGAALEPEAEPDEVVTAAISRLRATQIVTWALCESIAMFGLVAGFLYSEPLYFAPFGVVAVGALLFYAPRRTMFDEVVRAALKR